MDAQEIQQVSALVESTQRADDWIGKEGDCDCEAAAFQARASDNIRCPLSILACRAHVHCLLGLGDCQQHSGEGRLHGETACGAARLPRDRSAAARQHGSTARDGSTAGRWLRTRCLRGETAARGDGRAAAARRDGRMTRKPLACGMRGEAAAR